MRQKTIRYGRPFVTRVDISGLPSSVTFVWFTDPEQLLPMVHDWLVPGGRLVFWHAPAVPGSYGVQGIYAAGFTGRQVWAYRWAYEPATWAEILYRHGFRSLRARHESAPDPDNIGTLTVKAER